MPTCYVHANVKLSDSKLHVIAGLLPSECLMPIPTEYIISANNYVQFRPAHATIIIIVTIIVPKGLKYLCSNFCR